MPCGNQNVVRAYVWGVAAPYTCFNTHLSGQDIVFEGPAPLEAWTFRLTDEFFPASSNVYSVDHIFDADNCFHFFSALPSPALVYLGLGYATGVRELMVVFNCLVAADPGQIAELPQLSSYWLPRDPP
jgi:hypothetical protein